MADVNPIPAKQSLFYVWDADAAVPAFRPLGCLTTHNFSTTMNMSETEAVETFCGTLPAKQRPTGLAFQLTGDGIIVDTTTPGSEDINKASHDFLLALQQRQVDTGEASDFRIKRMDTPGIPDKFGKGFVSELGAGSNAADDNQTFSFTVTGIVNSLSDTTTVTPAE